MRGLLKAGSSQSRASISSADTRLLEKLRVPEPEEEVIGELDPEALRGVARARREGFVKMAGEFILASGWEIPEEELVGEVGGVLVANRFEPEEVRGEIVGNGV
jgi:hypothetical protein